MMINQSQSLKDKNQKKLYAHDLARSLSHMGTYDRSVYLSGLCGGFLQLWPDSAQIEEMHFLLKSIGQMISQESLCEVITESLYATKSKQIRENGLCFLQFKESLDHNTGGIMENESYLRKRWARELGGQYIEKGSQKPGEKIQEEDCSSFQFLKKQQEQQDRLFIQQRKKQQEQNQKIAKALIAQEQEQIRKKRQEKIKNENVAITCQICLEQIPFLDMGTLNCGHIFHKACIWGVIEAALNQKKVQIPCPTGSCKILSVDDIEQYIDGDLKQKYAKFSFDTWVQKSGAQASWCPSPGCTSVFTIEQGLDNYKCPVCQKHYCLSCRCEYHRNMSCAEYKISHSYSDADKKFEDFVRGAKFKQCPRCKYWVERSDGCSTMMCKCGQQFCYDCGGTDCPHGACKNMGGGIVRGLFRRRR